MNKKSGITLIEILIYSVVLTVVVALVTNFLYQVAHLKVLSQISSGLYENSQFILTKITQDIRNSQAVITPADHNLNSRLILQTDSGPVTYEVINGVLKRNNQAISDNQVEVSFVGANNGFKKIGASIWLKFSLVPKQKPFGKPKEVKIYQTAISLYY